MGSMHLSTAVRRVQPKMQVFGNVHGSRGREEGPLGIYFVNCATHQGNRLHPPVLVEFDSSPAVS
jgi:Icc-related predicted phosphoesterase